MTPAVPDPTVEARNLAEQVVDREGNAWRIVRDGGMATRAVYQGAISIGIAALERDYGPLTPLAARAAAPDALGDVDAAIRRIEESRQSHVEWAEHIPACEHCQKHGPPPYIQTEAEHRQIVAEYDAVLTILHAIPAATDVGDGGGERG